MSCEHARAQCYRPVYRMNFRRVYPLWLSMKISSAGPTVPGCRQTLLALLFIFTVGALAAEKKPAKNAAEPKNEPPVLMSRTGGGDIWADVKELTAAANKGNPKARAQLGEMLLRGDPVHKVVQDRPQAIALLEQAARAGEASAAFRIGMLLDDGDVISQDRTRALAYFRAAAAGGAKEAYFNIGAAYAGGRGVKPDLAEALGWLILAGRQGADPGAEQALRARLEAQRRWELIALGERRSREIEGEIAERKVVDLLPPPAPLAFATASPTAPKPVSK